MPSIAEIRQQYPMYDDMSDFELADALHGKFYADMPKAEFDKAIGLERPGNLEGFARGAAQGATFGFADELEGAVRAIGDDTYDQGVAKARARNEASPTAAYIGGNIAGAMAIPGLGTGGLVARGATTAARVARGAGVGAVEGGLAGLGAGEGSLAERAPSAAWGAALGLPFGAFGGYLTKAPVTKAASEFNFPLTKGQAAGDFSQIAKEELQRNSGTAAGNVMRAGDEAQRAAIGEVAGQMVPGAGNTAQAATDLVGAMQTGKQALKGEVKAAYKAFAEKSGYLRKEAVEGLQQRWNAALDHPETGFTDPTVRSWLEGTLENVRKAFQPAQGVEHVTIQQVDGARKAINRAIGGAKGQDNAAFKTGLETVKREFDDWLEQSVDSALYSGDATALAAVKNARELNTHYMSLVGKRPGDPAGQIIGKLLADDATPEEAINSLFGLRSLSKAGTREAVNRIKDLAPDAALPLQQASFTRLAYDATGQLKSPHMLAKAIRENAQQSPELMRALHGQDGVDKMLRFASELERTVTPKEAANASKTSYRVIEFLSKKLGMGAAAAEAVVTGSMGMPTFGMMSLLTKSGLTAANYLSAKSAAAAIRETTKLNRAPGALGATGATALPMWMAPMLTSQGQGQ